MVTCKVDTIAVPKMNSVRSTRKHNSANSINANAAGTGGGGGGGAGSNSSGFRLLDGDQLEAASSVSKNSVYKLKIDLMFDDTRSVRSNQLDDPRGSHRTRSIIMYGRSELASTAGDSSRSLTSFLQETQETNEAAKLLENNTKKDVQRISNSVQAQIEQLFTDVAKDATSTFAVTCLGSLPLKDKVTSLQGLQEPLKELYLKQLSNEQRNTGFLDICATGLRVKTNAVENGSSNSTEPSSNSQEQNVTPFHNIAVWSAVKFVTTEDKSRAAFLPLITDPDNIDKASLYQPLSAAEQQKFAQNKTHAPIFAVVMRSTGVPKVLECHGFICKSTEDAIVIAATLYQSLMAHVSSSSHRSTKRRTPRNQNGVSCISIASSSAMTGSNYLSRSQIVASGRKSSFRSSSGNSNIGGSGASGAAGGSSAPTRSGRKKRVSNSSLSSSSNIINEAVETTTEERKRKSHKTKRAPPVPAVPPGPSLITAANVAAASSISRGSQRNHHHAKKSADSGYRTSAGNLLGNGGNVVVPAANVPSTSASGVVSARNNDMNGDILTRVAIPRSGSFLNTGGLTRYKSRAARRHSGKLGGGGGGGSPLGFSELFNEFRLHENLNSLDEILYAIIDADGMSFNDLKPIYKEFLLKLAVTLTKDELFQRSKNIMRRQKKKKLKRRPNVPASPKKPRTLFFGAKNLKKVFQLGQFRACRGKPPKPPRSKNSDSSRRKSATPITIGPPTMGSSQNTQQQRSRIATSGSDVSVIRNDNGFNGPHRNSSSGYVSCSECSYDSEACTCISADRCYCSLRPDRNANNKLRRKQERNAAAAAAKKSHGTRNRHDSSNYTSGGSNANRSSYISCKSDDKCYCSMVEEESPNVVAAEDDTSSHSDTTWCDTDSCLSASKCYCKRAERRAAQRANAMAKSNGHLPNSKTTSAAAMLSVDSGNERTPPPPPRPPSSSSAAQRQRSSRSSGTRGGNGGKSADKLALDYELFTIGGSGKSVQPHEALSMKKSVEAAAIFADVKLSQTTDIKTLCPPPPPPPVAAAAAAAAAHFLNGHANKEFNKAFDKLAALNNTKNRGSCRSYSSSSAAKKHAASQAFNKRRDSYSIDRKNERTVLSTATLSSNASHKSCSADDLLSKLSAIEKAASVRSKAGGANGGHKRLYGPVKETFHSNYQSMRAVSASLEDTLGYLP